MAVAKTFKNGQKFDKGTTKAAIAMVPLTGNSPRGLNVLSGTSAELYEIEIGKCYAMQATEQVEGMKGFNPDAEDKNGDCPRQFQFRMLVEVDAWQAVTAGIASPPVIEMASQSVITEDSKEEEEEEPTTKVKAKAKKATKKVTEKIEEEETLD